MADERNEYEQAWDDGMLEPGNIDLNSRPVVKNDDGSISTVRSMGINVDGAEVLIPTVSDDGRIMSDDEAIEAYRNTGRHLGKFASAQASDRYAQQLHENQADLYLGKTNSKREPKMDTEYENAWKEEKASKSSGYGIDPGKADMDAMAQAFAEPDVKVGEPIKIEKIEAEVLPPASGESSPEPVVEAETEKPTTPEVKVDAAPEAKADATPEFKTFGQAFKYHRAQAQNGGPSTFEWNGKKFTTQLKSEVAAAKPAAKKSVAKPNAEAAKFEEEFVNRDQPKIDRSKTLAYREGAASQPVNLNEDQSKFKTADELAAGVARAAALRDEKAPAQAPAAKDGRPWYQMGQKNTFIQEGDEPKNGPIYGSKPKGGESPAKGDVYRGKGTYQGELS